MSWRAYDTVTEWQGPVRETLALAEKDAWAHNRACARQGGYGSAIVVRPHPDAPDRCVDVHGATVWPPHGRSRGAVRWREDPDDVEQRAAEAWESDQRQRAADAERDESYNDDSFDAEGRL